DRGFTFAQSDGSYQIRSPFVTALGLDAATLLPAAQARAFWPAAVQVIAAQSAAAGAPLPAPLIQYLQQNLSGASLGLNYASPSAGSQQFPLGELNMQSLPAIRE